MIPPIFRMFGMMGGSVVSSPNSGGFFADFGEHLAVKAHQKREWRERERAIKEIDDRVEREIADILHRQEVKDLERAELERLKRIFTQAQNERELLTQRTLDAANRAHFDAKALQTFERELRQQMEDEEAAALLILMN